MLIVEDPQLPKPDEPWLAFETLTLCPIDTSLVLPKLLTAEERVARRLSQTRRQDPVAAARGSRRPQVAREGVQGDRAGERRFPAESLRRSGLADAASPVHNEEPRTLSREVVVEQGQLVLAIDESHDRRVLADYQDLSTACVRTGLVRGPSRRGMPPPLRSIPCTQP